LDGLLQLDPGRRTTAAAALRHPYFWAHPHACPPHHLLAGMVGAEEPCHELQTRKRKADARSAAEAEAAAEAAARAAKEAERLEAGEAEAPPPPPPPPARAPQLLARSSTAGMGFGAAAAGGWAVAEAVYGGSGGVAPPVTWPPAPPPQSAEVLHYERALAVERAGARAARPPPPAPSAAAAARLRARPACQPCRYYSAAQLAAASPSRAEGVDGAGEAAHRTLVVRFLEDVSRALAAASASGRDGLHRPVIATAAVFCHRFFACHSWRAYENRLHVLGVAALLLAGKIEGAPRTLADLVCASYRLRTGGGELLSEAAREAYPRERENVLDAERRLVRCLGFQFRVSHPFDHLLPAAARLRELAARPAPGAAPRPQAAAGAGVMESLMSAPEEGEGGAAGGGAGGARSAPAFDPQKLLQAAISFCNDSLRTRLALMHDSATLAAGFLLLAARMCGCGGEALDAQQAGRLLGCRLEAAAVREVALQLVGSYREAGLAAAALARLEAAAEAVEPPRAPPPPPAWGAEEEGELK